MHIDINFVERLLRRPSRNLSKPASKRGNRVIVGFKADLIGNCALQSESWHRVCLCNRAVVTRFPMEIRAAAMEWPPFFNSDNFQFRGRPKNNNKRPVFSLCCVSSSSPLEATPSKADLIIGLYTTASLQDRPLVQHPARPIDRESHPSVRSLSRRAPLYAPQSAPQWPLH